MDLLQANVSSASVLPDGDNDGVQDNATVNIVSENSLLPETDHLIIPGEVESGDSFSDQISVYVIRKGDSISEIANMFGVSVNTILSANDMKEGDKLVEGNVLLILPVSGIEHTITKGETLKNIANLYKVDVSDVAQFNGIAEDTELTVGDKIMIPGADETASDQESGKPVANLQSSVVTDESYYDTHPMPDIVGYFIDPLPTGHKTQGLHGPGHRGIDIGAPIGTPILASASGTVSLAHPGWSGGYGNMVIIDHSNGTKTLYAHMSRIGTHMGDQVSQGEVIGYVGSTGHSTGPHLHFEVFNARNPGADWSWALPQ
jgi:murein DD-endopeptidase MepM/ murein hydrolase activator NlpD